MRPVAKKRLPQELVTQELVQNLLKVSLRNPYLKRPHLMIKDEKTTFMVNRSWHVLENVAKSLPAHEEVELHEYWVEPEEPLELKSVAYENMDIEGNEARKLNNQELRRLFEKTIVSPGALILIIFDSSKLKLFIPINDELEWNQ
ncbi:hypothetical protein [Thermococcus aciditolerans]|uniref:Uncharacterized protein n=1 Tax=Thermococcus aciditolerans TaxID=2598455 RepID=A0A5C0SN91_9EURY|nr:hypothetical protein [Thermococcus aciditolerans]QEK15452.1 hypothetical protein FPV09_10545 [Thermococcus aciditolerans]